MDTGVKFSSASSPCINQLSVWGCYFERDVFFYSISLVGLLLCCVAGPSSGQSSQCHGGRLNDNVAQKLSLQDYCHTTVTVTTPVGSEGVGPVGVARPPSSPPPPEWLASLQWALSISSGKQRWCVKKGGKVFYKEGRRKAQRRGYTHTFLPDWEQRL